MKLTVSKRAASQIERIQAWWVRERTKAPALFLDELAAAERQLRATPELGTVYKEQKTGKVRRVLMPRTHHHLYYRYQVDRDELTVLHVWGAVKERGPRL